MLPEAFPRQQRDRQLHHNNKKQLQKRKSQAIGGGMDEGGCRWGRVGRMGADREGEGGYVGEVGMDGG